MEGLRAKFKDAEQLKIDTKKLTSKTFGENVDKLPKSITVTLSATGGFVYGVVDVALKLVKSVEEDDSDFITYFSEKDKTLDKIVFDTEKLKNNLDRANKVFNNRVYRAVVELESLLSEPERSFFHEFGKFDNLVIKVELDYDNTKELIYSLILSKYYALNNYKSVFDLKFNSDGTFVLSAN